MPRFTFTVTRDITERATVTIEAASIKEAHDKALVGQHVITGWKLEQGGYTPEAYIHNEDDYKEED